MEALSSGASLDVVKTLLKDYRELLDAASKLKERDHAVFERVERAAVEVAAALTMMRTRALLDPLEEREVEEALASS